MSPICCGKTTELKCVLSNIVIGFTWNVYLHFQCKYCGNVLVVDLDNGEVTE